MLKFKNKKEQGVLKFRKKVWFLSVMITLSYLLPLKREELGVIVPLWTVHTTVLTTLWSW